MNQTDSSSPDLSGIAAAELPSADPGHSEGDSTARIQTAQQRLIIEQNNRIIELLEDMAREQVS